jgi:hypothetical protein
LPINLPVLRSKIKGALFEPRSFFFSFFFPDVLTLRFFVDKKIGKKEGFLRDLEMVAEFFFPPFFPSPFLGLGFAFYDQFLFIKEEVSKKKAQVFSPRGFPGRCWDMRAGLFVTAKNFGFCLHFFSSFFFSFFSLLFIVVIIKGGERGSNLASKKGA